jgi:hypothetical protein
MPLFGSHPITYSPEGAKHAVLSYADTDIFGDTLAQMEFLVRAQDTRRINAEMQMPTVWKSLGRTDADFIKNL